MLFELISLVGIVGIALLLVAVAWFFIWGQRRSRDEAGETFVSLGSPDAVGCENGCGCDVVQSLPEPVPPQWFRVSLKPSSTGRVGRPLPCQARREHVVQAANPQRAKQLVSRRCGWLGTVHFRVQTIG